MLVIEESVVGDIVIDGLDVDGKKVMTGAFVGLADGSGVGSVVGADVGASDVGEYIESCVGSIVVIGGNVVWDVMAGNISHGISVYNAYWLVLSINDLHCEYERFWVGLNNRDCVRFIHAEFR